MALPKSADRLRAAGFHPIPRWWVTLEELSLIKYMADKHSEKVNEIRAGVREDTEAELQKEAAWASHKTIE